MRVLVAALAVAACTWAHRHAQQAAVQAAMCRSRVGHRRLVFDLVHCCLRLVQARPLPPVGSLLLPVAHVLELLAQSMLAQEMANLVLVALCARRQQVRTVGPAVVTWVAACEFPVGKHPKDRVVRPS